MREIYLDNSATTALLPQVAEVMQNVLIKQYGNPSSLHRKGMEAEKIKNEARRTIAAGLDVKGTEVYFTSGGTEANNLAIKGIARRHRRRGNHLITTKVEHPSVLYTCRALEQEGFAVTYLDVDRHGLVSPQEVLGAMREDTILVSIMHVNNEVGTIMPVAKIGQLIKAKKPDLFYHVDAVQSFGKLEVQPKKWQADLLSISAHKIAGPKGIGALYLRDKILIDPLLHGGDQEKGIRPGTENMSGIAGFAQATKIALHEREKNIASLEKLKKYLHTGILTHITNVTINGPSEGAPHILNVFIKGIKGEVLVHALEDQGIYISTGSACHSHRADPSHVLAAMGKQDKEIEASLRFGLSPYNTIEEIDFTIKKLQEAVQALRPFTGRNS